MVKRSVGNLLLTVLIFTLIVFSAVSAPVLGRDFPDSSVNNTGKGVLSIKTYDWKGTLLHDGMGYFSSEDGDITTVVPAIEGGYFVEAISHDGREYVIEQINPLSQSSGLVFARTEEKPPNFTYIDKVAPFPEQGDEVWITDIDEEGYASLQKTVILEAREVPGSKSYLFVKTSLSLGGAGNPVINEKGEIVGMVLLLAENRDDAGIIVSTDRISSTYGVSGEVVALLAWTEERTTSWVEGGVGFYLRGFISYQVGDYQSAVKYLEKVIDEKTYGTRKASMVLGDCYSEMGEDLKAIEAYEKALGRERKLRDSHLKLARLYLKQNRVTDARHILEKTAKYNQKGSNSIIMTAWLLDVTGHRDEALEVAKKAAEIDPTSARAQGTLGEILSKQGKFSEAFIALEQSVLLQPEKNEFAPALCYAAIYSGRHKKAIKACDKATRSDNNKTLNLMYLGDAYAAAGLDVKALESYRLSVEEDPYNLKAQCRIGDLLTKTGQHREAAAVFQDTLATFPDSAWIHFKLGKVYGLMGNRKGAAEKVLVLKDINRTLADQLALRLVAKGLFPRH